MVTTRGTKKKVFSHRSLALFLLISLSRRSLLLSLVALSYSLSLILSLSLPLSLSLSTKIDMLIKFGSLRFLW